MSNILFKQIKKVSTHIVDNDICILFKYTNGNCGVKIGHEYEHMFSSEDLAKNWIKRKYNEYI